MAHHAHADAHHDHHGDGHSHGSFKSYMTGFVLSVILTVIPFWIVMSGGFENPTTTILTVTGFAIVQIIVHVIYFLHVTPTSEEGWTLTSTVFTLVVVGIMVSGSVWVMFNMNANMMPNHSMTVSGVEQGQGMGSGAPENPESE
ncbi:cytochrome o ubiquinol oxidase subunit IV [Falsirhodobacter algicola]|uniref:Cytochrome bo(3) ubiquinol oxidase subunit 4 n=1 Tax=Falsirhodobacter algicola TaxID=2692330 RepID=A0A8J8MTB6_9RHOB|nr:cytochrome o ubiquinol oxidase subunit IV [Falsirhodobacter algicola]QUS36097.1 cytochrome o ubiquinol oxidase subunit IV [Falsirhodobacter algicola]